MWRYSLLVTSLAMGLAACTSLQPLRTAEGQPPAYPPSVFSHRVGTTQVVLYWNCLRPDPGVLSVEGVAHNPYFSEIRFLEFELVGVNSEDRAVSEARGEVPDFLLRTNQISPFRLDLRTVGSEVRFDLYYSHRSQQNLRSFLAGPPVGGPRLFVQATNRFLARDVCSERQHRIPQPIR